MTPITERMQAVIAAIEAAERQAGRPSGLVHLIAVSKTQPATSLREAYLTGQSAFGENYLQEALAKMESLADLSIEWHFIGPIQSNKTRPIAEHFDWVHSVDRLKIAQRLNDARPASRPPLNVCIEVNVSHETSKEGVAPDAVPALAEAIQQLPRLRLRGLMTIPAPTDDPALQRRPFHTLKVMLSQLQQRWPDLDTLSMGMSQDFAAAIAEGATHIRIGTAIFGPRPSKQGKLQ